MNLRNKLRDDLDLRIFVLTGEQIRAARFEVGKKRVEIQPEMLGPVRLQIIPAAVIQLFRSARVAIAEMIEAHRGLNQALVEAPLRTLAVRPQLFPHLVRLEKLALVEV